MLIPECMSERRIGLGHERHFDQKVVFHILLSILLCGPSRVFKSGDLERPFRFTLDAT